MMTRRRLATAAAIAAMVVGGALFALSRTGRPSAIPPAPTTTASSPLTFNAPPGTPAPLDSTTTTDASVVSWKVSGSCFNSGRTFLCKVTVTASNHLQSGGVVEVFPGKGYGPACEWRGDLSQDSATISGACEEPFAGSVLAVYSSTVNVSPPLARANLPWSRGTGNHLP